MIHTLFYFALALLGLGVLIFIHELGHYWMARRVGMRVETFAIGFGSPIYSWKVDGVNWQIGWIPFGGYVKIAGTDTTGDQDPYEIKDGFFGKSPWDRIKVAFMGPLANLIVAMVLFTAVWAMGGREKSFSEYTPIIGWIDPSSELYLKGVRPGDEVSGYNNVPFESSKDHLYGPMTSDEYAMVTGYHINYQTDEKTPFEYKVAVYPHPASLKDGIMTAGILNSAAYVIYDKLPNGGDNPIPEGSPMKDSGISYGDRVIWVDGEVIFSPKQLEKVLNDGKALLTILRGSQTILRRVPRIEVQELKLDPTMKEELIDWQYAALLKGSKIQDLYTIPYNLTNDNVVENALLFIDPDKEKEAFQVGPLAEVDSPLNEGDKIIAIDGRPVQKAFELFAFLQQRFVNVIVEKDPTLKEIPNWKEASSLFLKGIDWKSLKMMAQSIGTVSPIVQNGELHLLRTIQPKTKKEIFSSEESQAQFAAEMAAVRKQVEEIENPEKRAAALKTLDFQEKQLLLGLPLIQDRKILYNPDPQEQFKSVAGEIIRTLEALFTGSLNPKFMSGPVGIVRVVQENAQVGIKEALFWLGAISLNLGMLNLLPIPVLDGGNILISLVEMITGRKMKPKELERLIIPFAVLLIGFFVFLTYNDLRNLFEGYFKW